MVRKAMAFSTALGSGDTLMSRELRWPTIMYLYRVRGLLLDESDEVASVIRADQRHLETQIVALFE